MTTDVHGATLWDLGKGEFLFVRCGARIQGRPCDHTGVVLPSTLPSGFDVHTRLCHLARFLKCTKCGQRSVQTRIAVWHR
jgi:hypothetical protein